MANLLSLLITNPVNLLTCVAVALCGWFIKSSINLLIAKIKQSDAEFNITRRSLLDHSEQMLGLSKDISLARAEIMEEVIGLKKSMSDLDNSLLKNSIITQDIIKQNESISKSIVDVYGRIDIIESEGPMRISPLNERDLILKATAKIKQLKLENDQLRRKK